MDYLLISIWINFIGTCLIGASQQVGIWGGWGGETNFKNRAWKFINGLGWCLLASGFFAQIILIYKK
jgi:hypothetical protein